MTPLSDLDMARTKKSAPKPEPKPTVISLKGSGEWRVWLQELSSHCRTDAAKVIDAALIDYAKTKGFMKKAPPR